MIDLLFTLEKLDYLIYTTRTGTRGELSAKLNISERTISRYIDYLRSFGAEIEFCRSRKSYYYKYKGKFVFKIEFKLDS